MSRLTPERLEEIKEFVYGCMLPPAYAHELIDEIDRLNEAILEEREACAKIAEEMATLFDTNTMMDQAANARSLTIAHAIRARGEK